MANSTKLLLFLMNIGFQTVNYIKIANLKSYVSKLSNEGFLPYCFDGYPCHNGTYYWKNCQKKNGHSIGIVVNSS